MRVVPKSRWLTIESARTMGMYVPKSPTDPPSSDQMAFFIRKLVAQGRFRHRRWRRGVDDWPRSTFIT